MPRQGLTHIEVLLDRSGSMTSIQRDMEGGFNNFIKEQQAEPGTATVGLSQFDTEHDTIYVSLPIDEVPALRLVPRGGTALVDAQVKSIDALGDRLRKMADRDRPEQVIFVIITDGGENSSRMYRRDDVMKRISHQESRYGWTFIFLGANQDAVAEAATYGIRAANAMTYGASAQGVSSSSLAMSNAVSATRIGGAFRGFSEEEREASK